MIQLTGATSRRIFVLATALALADLSVAQEPGRGVSTGKQPRQTTQVQQLEPPIIEDVSDGASFRPVLAPGGIFSLFGTNLASATFTAESVPLPALLGTVRVFAGGRETPLFFASPGQINGQLHYDAPAGEIDFVVEVNGARSDAFPVIVRERSPAIFQSPYGTCLAQRPDGSLISADSPLAEGDAFTLYTTGQGKVAPSLAGVAAAETPLSLVEDPSRFTVELDGHPVERTFFGLAPNMVSVGQLNLVAPAIDKGVPVNLSIAADGGLPNACQLPVTSFHGDQPQIEFTSVPVIGTSTNLHGRVHNAPPSAYKVAVFINVSGRWWTKPYANSPATPIRDDGTWETDVTTGGFDANAGELVAFLLNTTDELPVLLNQPELPPSLEQNAVATVSVVRQPLPPPYRGRVMAPVNSTFDADLEGWTGSEIRFVAEIGNPGGSMEFQDLNRGNGFAAAPAKYLGFWSHLDGKGFIAFEHLVLSRFDPRYLGDAVPREIRLSGPGGSATWTGTIPVLSTYWFPVGVLLDAAEWTVTSGTWRNLLDQVTGLEIRVDLFNDSLGAERTQFDNVILLPEAPLPPPPTPPRGPLMDPVVSTFDTDLEGWRDPDVSFVAEGNPGGAMQFHERYSPMSGFAFAPEKFLGDWSHLNGTGVIAFEHRVPDAASSAGLWGSSAAREIRLAGPGGAAFWTGSRPEFTGEWLKLTATLDEASWTVTEGTWQDLLKDVDTFQIRVDHFNDSVRAEQTQFDNISVTRSAAGP